MKDATKNGYLEISNSGVIISIGQIDRECESTEFYNGALFPGLVEKVVKKLGKEPYLADIEAEMKEMHKEGELSYFDENIAPGIILIDNIDFKNMKLTVESTLIKMF